MGVVVVFGLLVCVIIVSVWSELHIKRYADEGVVDIAQPNVEIQLLLFDMFAGHKRLPITAFDVGSDYLFVHRDVDRPKSIESGVIVLKKRGWVIIHKSGIIVVAGIDTFIEAEFLAKALDEHFDWSKPIDEVYVSVPQESLKELLKAAQQEAQEWTRTVGIYSL